MSGMDECLKIESAVSPADYEVLGCGPTPHTSPGAPALGRRNSEKMVSGGDSDEDSCYINTHSCLYVTANGPVYKCLPVVAS